MNGRHRVVDRNIRSTSALLVLTLLAIPASVSFAVMAKSVRAAYGQLRTATVPEDTQLQNRFAQLNAFLPPGGRLGFWDRRTGPPEDPPRLRYFLQYSVAPVVVREPDGAAFVVIVDDAAAASVDARLMFVVDVGAGIRLFRWNQ